MRAMLYHHFNSCLTDICLIVPVHVHMPRSEVFRFPAGPRVYVSCSSLLPNAFFSITYFPFTLPSPLPIHPIPTPPPQPKPKPPVS